MRSDFTNKTHDGDKCHILSCPYMSHLKMKKRVRNADNLMLKIINKILAVAV